MLSDNGYNKMYAKIRMNDTVALEPGDKEQRKHHGIFIDIFPLDIGYELSSSRFSIYKLKIILAHYLDDSLQNRRMRKKNSGIRKIFSLIPVPIAYKLCDKLYQHYAGGFVISHSGNGGEDYMEINRFAPASEVWFEGKKYKAPKDVDYVLTKMYGEDYMDMPPKEKRVSHSFEYVSFNF